MIKIEVTENYGGIHIFGDYYDFNELYDSFNVFLQEDFIKNERVELMQNHVYGFLYDLRHAYQGDRSFILVDNNLDDVQREAFKIKKGEVGPNNYYYELEYPLLDIILDMLLMKRFTKIRKDAYHEALISAFYAKVIEAIKFESLLGKIQMNKLIAGIKNAYDINLQEDYCMQWFEELSIKYLGYTKIQRKKYLNDLLKKIYNYNDFKEYYEMKKEIDNFCKKEKCRLEDIHTKKYPTNIEL